MRVIIFSNGQMDPSAIKNAITSQAYDLLLAADGGASNCMSLGLTPAVVIGDLDSLSQVQQDNLRSQGVKFIQYPERKDYTDLELALTYAQAKGAKEILILGELGARWDQTVANLLLPARFPTMLISLLDHGQEIHYLPAGKALRIYGQPGDIVSLMSREAAPVCRFWVDE